jgi:Fe2+ or Zn2+ uptake regulation protein
MSIFPNTTKKEYLYLIDIIKKRFEKHNQVFSSNEENIFKILFECTEHLSLDEIVKNVYDIFEVDLNGSLVYKTLSSFETLGIVENIMIDEKKRYELSYFKNTHYHLYCQECNKIEEFESAQIHQSFVKHLMDVEFRATNFNVIINGVCKKCQN